MIPVVIIVLIMTTYQTLKYENGRKHAPQTFHTVTSSPPGYNTNPGPPATPTPTPDHGGVTLPVVPPTAVPSQPTWSAGEQIMLRGRFDQSPAGYFEQSRLW